MKRLTNKEADELLRELLKLRRKYEKYRSKKNYQNYYNFESYCGKKFDYLVISRSYKYKSFPNYDDLKQDGRIALLLALRSFEPDKGNFFWWADKYIKTKISREANRHSTIKIPLKHAQETQPYKVSDIPILIDPEENALEQAERVEMKTQIDEAISQLPDLQKKIIKLNGIKSYSINKISKELKIARPTCIKLLNEAKQNLKQQLEHLNT